MTILDTNVYIYLANGTLDRQTIASTTIAHASITEIEALGHMNLPISELLLLEALFAESHALALTAQIINRAVRLRQAKRMSLGDAVVAATALEHDCELWTANTGDYSHIEELRLVNPLQ